jgi:hypothetical protein
VGIRGEDASECAAVVPLKTEPTREQHAASSWTVPCESLTCDILCAAMSVSAKWPCLFGPVADESPSSPLRQGLRVYAHRSFGCDIVATYTQNERDKDGMGMLMTGYRRLGHWIDVGEGWIPWRLNGGKVLVQPIAYGFHPAIVEMGAQLNVRTNPSPDGDIIATVDGSVQFHAVSVHGDWLKIKWPVATSKAAVVALAASPGEEGNKENSIGSPNAAMVESVCAFVLMKTAEGRTLLVPQPLGGEWLLEDVRMMGDEGDTLSDTSSPSGSPISFHPFSNTGSPAAESSFLGSSPASTPGRYKNDDRPLPTTAKRRVSEQHGKFLSPIPATVVVVCQTHLVKDLSLPPPLFFPREEGI